MPENPVEDIMSEVPSAIEEVELLLFLLDGSGSMTETQTHDGRPKVDHLMEIMNDLIPRLRSSEAAPRFRCQAVYFSAAPHTKNNYQALNEFAIENPVQIAGGGMTAIAATLENALEILEKFDKDQTLPPQKLSTVFLITDGQETSGGDVRNAASRLKGNRIAPMLATVGIGDDVDEQLLLDIASEPTPRQLKHLDNHQLLDYIPDKSHLYLRAHEKGRITKNTAEALRRYVQVLSESRK